MMTAVHVTAPTRARDVLTSEWIKLRSVRSTYLVLLFAAAAAVGIGYLVTHSDATHWATMSAQARAAFDPVYDSFTGLGLAQLAFGALGVLAISSEYAERPERQLRQPEAGKGVVDRVEGRPGCSAHGGPVGGVRMGHQVPDAHGRHRGEQQDQVGGAEGAEFDPFRGEQVAGPSRNGGGDGGHDQAAFPVSAGRVSSGRPAW